jgi:hypothetical protein
MADEDDEDDKEEEHQSPEDRMLANLDLNRYLRLDREGCDDDTDRQNALASAIKIAKSVAMAEPPLHLNRESRPNFYDSTMFPSAEFICLLMHGSFCVPWCVRWHLP